MNRQVNCYISNLNSNGCVSRNSSSFADDISFLLVATESFLHVYTTGMGGAIPAAVVVVGSVGAIDQRIDAEIATEEVRSY
jgi:hypothetical protein